VDGVDLFVLRNENEGGGSQFDAKSEGRYGIGRGTRKGTGARDELSTISKVKQEQL